MSKSLRAARGQKIARADDPLLALAQRIAKQREDFTRKTDATLAVLDYFALRAKKAKR